MAVATTIPETTVAFTHLIHCVGASPRVQWIEHVALLHPGHTRGEARLVKGLRVALTTHATPHYSGGKGVLPCP